MYEPLIKYVGGGVSIIWTGGVSYLVGDSLGYLVDDTFNTDLRSLVTWGTVGVCETGLVAFLAVAFSPSIEEEQ